jgi:hypothetical protein
MWKSKSSVAVAFYFPGRAKDLSAPLYYYRNNNSNDDDYDYDDDDDDDNTNNNNNNKVVSFSA